MQIPHYIFFNFFFFPFLLRYEHELVQHARDVEALNTLKVSITGHTVQVEQLSEAKANAEKAFAETKAAMEEMEARLKGEYAKLQVITPSFLFILFAKESKSKRLRFECLLFL